MQEENVCTSPRRLLQALLLACSSLGAHYYCLASTAHRPRAHDPVLASAPRRASRSQRLLVPAWHRAKKLFILKFHKVWPRKSSFYFVLSFCWPFHFLSSFCSRKTFLCSFIFIFSLILSSFSLFHFVLLMVFIPLLYDPYCVCSPKCFPLGTLKLKLLFPRLLCVFHPFHELNQCSFYMFLLFFTESFWT